jgi:hypothetical protein
MWVANCKMHLRQAQVKKYQNAKCAIESAKLGVFKTALLIIIF